MSDLLLFLVKNPCDDINVLRIFVLVREVLKVVFTIVPIILIVLVMIDIAKNVIAKNDEDMDKNKKLAIKRAIYAVFIFFVPTVVNIFMGAIGDLASDYSSCMNVTKEGLALRIETEKSKCNGMGSDYEWNEGLSECVIKKEYANVDPKTLPNSGADGVKLERSVTNVNKTDDSSDDNTGTGDYTGSLGLPLAGSSLRISSGFGYRPPPCSGCSSYHLGMDFSAVDGTKVYAVDGGEVVTLSYSAKRGSYIIIKHSDDLYTIYQHLSQFEVKTNAKVDKGMIIALSGHSGVGTGPHLHFEMSTSVTPGKGKSFDPCTFKSYTCTNGGKKGGYISVK